MTWNRRRGQIKHALYVSCFNGWIPKSTFKEMLDDLNTVKPVKHSKPVVYYHGENTFSYTCGVCHMPIDGKDHYCRWCGARMDEVAKNGND